MTHDTEDFEELDILSSFHWASQSEVYSVLHLPGFNALAVPTAPFPSRTGVIALPAASVDPELEEERTFRASARLSQLLDWNAPSENHYEVIFIEPSEEQWVGVSTVLAALQGATGFHADGRVPQARTWWLPTQATDATGSSAWMGC